MRLHLDVLGWLYVLAGAVGVFTGAALLVLAAGTALAVGQGAEGTAIAVPAVWLLVSGGALFGAGGALMIGAGRALIARRRRGRTAALLLGIVNLFLLPFGTALGVYTCWTLLNDEARRAFGGPARSRADAS